MRYLVWFLLGGILGLLVYLGTLTPYREHLLYDVSVYYQRSIYFFDHANLTDVQNEYLPGATLFFTLFSPSFFLGNSLEIFEKTFIAGNCLLLLFLGWLIYKEQGNKNVFLFCFLLLCAGPIILYRFETLVILMMLLALLFFQKKKFWESAFFLSIGMLVKLYPVLLLPYFMILAFKEKGPKAALFYIAIFGLTTIGGILFYFFVTQTSFKELIFSLDFHKDKPLGLESPLASLHHLIHYLQTGLGAPIVARHNTWGVDDNYLLLPMPILTYLWLIPVLIFYAITWFSKTKKASVLFLVSFLSIFFIFSKLFTPQYWLWVLFLLPFLKSNKSVYLWTMIISASLAMAIIQFIYPLHYFSFLAFFYNQDKKQEYLFWIYLLEILGMIFTAVLTVFLVRRDLKHSPDR